MENPMDYLTYREQVMSEAENASGVTYATVRAAFFLSRVIYGNYLCAAGAYTGDGAVVKLQETASCGYPRDALPTGIRTQWLPVTKMRAEVFAGNTHVTDVILPKKLEGIPSGAFRGCTALRRVVIPRTVKRIGENAFAGCDALSDVYYEGSYEEFCAIRAHAVETVYGSRGVGNRFYSYVQPTEGNGVLLRVRVHCHCKL